MESAYTNAGKNFYCNICHTRFERGKNAIQAHERSQKHTRAKDKETKRMMKQRKEVSDEQLIEQERERLDARNRARYSGAQPANKPIGSKGDKPGHAGQPGESGYGARKDQKGKDHKEKEPAQPLPRYELGLSLKDNEGFAAGANMFGGLWTLAKDDETGKKLVFYNRKSGVKYPERPRGVKLSPEDEKRWEEYQNNPTQDVEVILNPEAAQGLAGQWEEVDATEDFYAANAIDPDLDIAEEPVEDEDEKRVEEQLEKLDEMNEDEINDLLNLDKEEEGKSLLRSKTDKLKRYIDANLEAVSKPTFQKESDILFKRSLENRGFNGDGNDTGKGGNLFKKKKKVQGNERVILGFENENEIE